MHYRQEKERWVLKKKSQNPGGSIPGKKKVVSGKRDMKVMKRDSEYDSSREIKRGGVKGQTGEEG